jgi:hypothetical protein
MHDIPTRRRARGGNRDDEVEPLRGRVQPRNTRVEDGRMQFGDRDDAVA